jgi:hypothetical protein
MSQSAHVRIGHATLYIEVSGCTGCGTKYSDAWYDAESISVLIGSQSRTVQLHLCSACHKKKYRGQSVAKELHDKL